MSATGARRRYALWECLFMGAFVAAYLSTQSLLESTVSRGVGAHALLLSPLLPLVAALFCVYRQHRNADELERQIELQSMTLAAGVLLTAATGWGFLVREFGYRSFPLDFSLPIAIAVWMLVRTVVSLRYR